MKLDRVTRWPGSLVLAVAAVLFPFALLPFRAQPWAPWAAIVGMFVLVTLVRHVQCNALARLRAAEMALREATGDGRD